MSEKTRISEGKEKTIKQITFRGENSNE